jgi:hypothetical protein
MYSRSHKPNQSHQKSSHISKMNSFSSRPFADQQQTEETPSNLQKNTELSLKPEHFDFSLLNIPLSAPNKSSAFVQTKLTSEQIQRDPYPLPQESLPNSSTSKSPAQIISDFHGLWMKDMLQRLAGLDKNQLEEMHKIVATVPGINVARTLVAIEAALGLKFSQSSLNWLEINASSGGFWDQVIEIRDFMKPDAFDRSASTLLAKITKQIQASYTKAVQDSQTDAKDAKKTNPSLPETAQIDLEKLKILSPLAAIQLQAVINAQGYLSMDNSKAHDAVNKATGLTSDQQWCGGFAATNYIPLQLSAQLRGIFWSTEKLLDFFTYKHGYDPYQWINVGDDNLEVQTYHQQRGSLRKWLTGNTINGGGELDIRPGDIILQDNREGLGADHIQMVQSWDPTTQTLFTIDGNGGGYQVDNRSAKQREKDKPKSDEEKRKNIENVTGYKLGSRGSGVVGVGSYNLSQEPTEDEVTKARAKGKKMVRIVGIGRPSLVDFESQRYLTKLPKSKSKK